MSKNGIIIKDDSQDTYVSVQEICVLCHLSENELRIYIEQAIVEPENSMTDQEVKFTLQQMQRLQKALRLERDLQVNHEGSAIILTLLEELEELRTRLQIFERHYK